MWTDLNIYWIFPFIFGLLIGIGLYFGKKKIEQMEDKRANDLFDRFKKRIEECSSSCTEWTEAVNNAVCELRGSLDIHVEIDDDDLEEEENE